MSKITKHKLVKIRKRKAKHRVKLRREHEERRRRKQPLKPEFRLSGEGQIVWQATIDAVNEYGLPSEAQNDEIQALQTLLIVDFIIERLAETDILLSSSDSEHEEIIALSVIIVLTALDEGRDPFEVLNGI